MGFQAMRRDCGKALCSPIWRRSGMPVMFLTGSGSLPSIPRFICELFDELFTISDKPKEGLYTSAKRVAKKYVLTMDTIKDLLAARKL